MLGPIIAHFCPLFSRTGIFNVLFCKMVDNNKVLRFRVFPSKTFNSIFHKRPKTLFLVHFGPKSPNLVKTKNFLKNPLVPFMQKTRKILEPILIKNVFERMHRRTSFYINQSALRRFDIVCSISYKSFGKYNIRRLTY